MEKAWKVLYEAARLALNARRISDYVTAGEVSAAILSKVRENIYWWLY